MSALAAWRPIAPATLPFHPGAASKDPAEGCRAWSSAPDRQARRHPMLHPPPQNPVLPAAAGEGRHGKAGDRPRSESESEMLEDHWVLKPLRISMPARLRPVLERPPNLPRPCLSKVSLDNRRLMGDEAGYPL